MVQKLNLKGLILIIVSVFLAVISVFCWNKYQDCSTSSEKQQLLKEISRLTKEYNEAKELYEFKKQFFDYYGMQISTLDDDKEALVNYEHQINEQKSKLTYFNKKASTNKTYSVISICSSAVLLIVGIIVTIKGKKRPNNLSCEENFIVESTDGGEENV